jgi:hypothetical protein
MVKLRSNSPPPYLRSDVLFPSLILTLFIVLLLLAAIWCAGALDQCD